MRKYKYRYYKFYYPLLFRIEKNRLMKILLADSDSKAKIEHIGSTAVRGLGGKGAIDILISVLKNKINYTKKILIDNCYDYINDKKRDSREYFNKDRWFFGKYRIHIQLTYAESKVEKEAIKFRDILRRDKNLREEYSSIKQKAILLGKEKKEYRDFKYKFIEKVLKGKL